MSKASEVLTGVVSILTNDTTLQNLLGGSGRIFIRNAEIQRKIPSVTIWVTGDSPARIDENVQWILMLQLDIWGTSWSTSFAILDRCDALLLNKVITATHYKAIFLRTEGARQALADGELEGSVIKQVAAEYMLRVIKTS